MNDINAEALKYIQSLGATHIWYTGILEHATQTSYKSFSISEDHPAVVKGKAGSPYAVKDYYDVDPDLAVDVTQRLQEFQALIRRTHHAGLKVIIDFVPNHVARNYVSDIQKDNHDFGQDDNTSVFFSSHNNFYYIPNEPLHLEHICEDHSYIECPAKATGNNVFSAWPTVKDWYETVKLNYGMDFHTGETFFSPIPDTWEKMRNILKYWSSMGIDAFRCDMAEMVPVEFWAWVIPQIKSEFPQIQFIAEVYNPSLYRQYLEVGKFNFLYDKVGLYDTLISVSKGTSSAQEISHRWQEINDIWPHMLNFLENHDEPRLASDFLLGNPFRGKAPLMVSALMNTNPYMLYFAQEVGERGMDEEGFSGLDGRTTIFDYWAVKSMQPLLAYQYTQNGLNVSEQQLLAFYQQILNLKDHEPLFAEGHFYDLMYVNPHLHQQYAFLRYTQNKTALVIANFSSSEEEVSVNISSHFFEFSAKYSKLSTEGEELLTKTKVKIPFCPEKALIITVPASSGVILTINL